MKKLKILIVLIVIGILSSCSTEKEESYCNCGLIIDDNVTNYSIRVKNECSNNIKTFYLSRGEWMNAFVGDNYCGPVNQTW